ncbi:alpha/beta fold hydrolase [Streptomyces mirabilis]|uniref:alpha/beta hydrolase n=1 Tax=Streptomyces mirabilis TaxID=68239 RepID=UPI0035E32D2D
MLPLAAEGYRCVGFDRRGHGRSDDVWGGFDLDTLADDVDGLLRHLDLSGVTLVGHSIGTAEVVRCLTRASSGWRGWHSSRAWRPAPSGPRTIRRASTRASSRPATRSSAATGPPSSWTGPARSSPSTSPGTNSPRPTCSP